MVISASTVAALLLSVTCSALAQILLKHGMAESHVQTAIAAGGIQATLRSMATSGWLAGGFLMYALSMLIWLRVLARVDVSVAYPFVALGILITIVLASFTLGEPLTVRKLLGAVLVIAGVYCVATIA